MKVKNYTFITIKMNIETKDTVETITLTTNNGKLIAKYLRKYYPNWLRVTITTTKTKQQIIKLSCIK